MPSPIIISQFLGKEGHFTAILRLVYIDIQSVIPGPRANLHKTEL